MLYEKLFQLLARADVQEIALQTDRPPCVLVGSEYTPVVNRAFSEDEVVAILVEANGRVEVMGLVEGARRWQYDHPTLGAIRVSAGYHGALLQARLKLVERKVDAPSTERKAPSAPSDAFESLVTRNSGEAAGGRPAQGTARVPAVPGARPSAPTTGSQRAYQGTARVPAVGNTPSTPNGGVPLAAPPAAGRTTQGTARVPAMTSKPSTPTADTGRVPAVGSVGALPIEPPPPATGRMPTVGARPSMPTASARPYQGTARVPAVGAAPEPAPASKPIEPAPKAVELPTQLTGTPAEIFEQLLRLSRDRKASDLHIVADRPPMLRMGGEMTKVGGPLSASVVETMLMAIVPKRLHAELERDGSCDFALQHASFGRFRTNVSRQRTGMKLTARPVSAQVPTLADLGLPDAITGATHHHQGLIIVTGPTGHGKTTTLAAIVDIVNSERSDHIITVEDPVEYVHVRKKAVVSQREVGTHTKSFAAALKGSLREDPDVIAVGELRDTETVRMALSASETGHLVISTMNTPSAAKAIERLIDLFPPGDQPQVRMSLAGGLRMIISQRLVPSADRKTVKAAVELLPGSPPLWALIRDNKTFQIPSLQQRGKSLGIVRLDDSLAELVRSGHTSIEIAKEFAEAPEQLEAVVKGAPVKPPEAAPANDPAKEAAAAAQKFGKDMFSKAGKLFGGDK